MIATDHLDQAAVAGDVWLRHPDYRALLVVAEHVQGGVSDDRSDALLRAAEASATRLLADGSPEALPQVAVWRAAFATFGVKPRAGRSSVEALLRRCSAGLPRIDLLTDAYNAVSVQHLLPIGGEDLDGYTGPPQLVVAAGSEPFETTAGGKPVIDHPAAGEIVWRDDAGVTCRRWNWRQCTRTRLTPATTRALFILDGLGPRAEQHVIAAGVALMATLAELSPSATFTQRLLSPVAPD